MPTVGPAGVFKRLIGGRGGTRPTPLVSGGLLPGPDVPAHMTRAEIDVDDLLKIVLGLAVVWLLLEILGTVLDLTFALLDALPTLIVVVIVVLIALRLADRI
jgi:hypothetical protein